MKKTLLAFGALVISASSMAQVIDTLTSHFNGNPTMYVPDAVAPLDSGIISGNNAYGDLAKMQLFDPAYGVAGGTITSVLLAVGDKVDMGGSFQVAIWGDNAGQPANPLSPLALQSVTLASVDTSLAGFSIVDGTRFYNVAVNLSSAVTIPGDHKFWAGIVLPTGGNSMALYTTNMQTNPFADAVTHTGEFWDNGSFHTFGDANNWNADLALAIYPVVSLTASVNENVVEAVVYPNPANDVLNIKAKEDVTTINVMTMDGKLVASANGTTVNVDGLSAGMYMYEAVTVTGKVARGNFSKK